MNHAQAPHRIVYSADDRERFVAESPKNPERTDFERDRARIVHSSALRRLGAKTQVLGPISDDFVRTRLTHSLEVAQVGRELGKELGADPDVVEAACLSHDLGHPPFGHNGERVLNDLAQDAGGFEGNAQTLRIVVRLEPKVVAPDGAPSGLNLTRATLDAIAKYPWKRGQGPDPDKSMKKFGVYEDDAEVFTWMRGDVPAGRRCLEAQIMDLSDDIGYCVHDVEDAIATRAMDVSHVSDDEHVAGIIDSTLQWYGPGASASELEAAMERLLALPVWLHRFDGTYADLAALKNLTSQLIGRFCQSVVAATREVAGDGPLGRHHADLVIPRDVRAEIQLLKGIAVHYVMSPRETEPVYLHQRTILADLVDALLESRGQHLEEPFATAWQHADGDAERLRVVIDQVATLTDISASQWHARLCGLLSTQWT